MEDRTQAMLAAIARRQSLAVQDAMLSGGFAGFVTTATRGDLAMKPLTLDDILEMKASVRPTETWRISNLFPPNKVTVCKTPGETFYLVHPMTSYRVAAAWRESLSPEQRHNPLYDLPMMELDPHESDDAGTAEWRALERKRVFDAIAGTVTAEVELGRLFGKC